MHVYVVLFRSLCDGSSIELGRSMVVIRELCSRTLFLYLSEWQMYDGLSFVNLFVSCS